MESADQTVTHGNAEESRPPLLTAGGGIDIESRRSFSSVSSDDFQSVSSELDRSRVSSSTAATLAVESESVDGAVDSVHASLRQERGQTLLEAARIVLKIKELESDKKDLQRLSLRAVHAPDERGGVVVVDGGESEEDNEEEHVAADHDSSPSLLSAATVRSPVALPLGLNSTTTPFSSPSTARPSPRSFRGTTTTSSRRSSFSDMDAMMRAPSIISSSNGSTHHQHHGGVNGLLAKPKSIVGSRSKRSRQELSRVHEDSSSTTGVTPTPSIRSLRIAYQGTGDLASLVVERDYTKPNGEDALSTISRSSGVRRTTGFSPRRSTNRLAVPDDQRSIAQSISQMSMQSRSARSVITESEQETEDDISEVPEDGTETIGEGDEDDRRRQQNGGGGGGGVDDGNDDPTTTVRNNVVSYRSYPAADDYEAYGTAPRAIDNLPHWNDIENGAPTSLPNQQIARDLDYSMRKLLSVQVFEELLKDPVGRHRFRDFTMSLTHGSTAEIDLWLDLQNHQRLIENLQNNAEAIHDIFMGQGSQNRVRLPGNVYRETDTVLREKLAPKPNLAFHSATQYLLQHLYNNDFQTFIKQKIILAAEVKLGRGNLTNSDGLGDCFVLTNPRLRDHPIVLVSDGFNAVTGYPRSQVVGRNCRFLQGPSTSPESIQRIRDGLNNGEGSTELLLNYRRDGTPFYCLLTIIPLRDANGQLIYFIGGQTNVTGVFAESKGLSWMIAGNSSDGLKAEDVPKISPAMQEYQTGMSRSLIRSDASVSAAGSVRNGIAGYVEAPNERPGLYRQSTISSNGPGNGAISKMFRKQSNNAFGGSSVSLPLNKASISVASSMNGSFGSFKDVYAKLIVFKKTKREIIFVTKDLLSYLGLPVSSYQDLYGSPLIHSDLMDCISAGDKSATKALKEKIKTAIKNDESLSAECRLKLSTGWGLFPGRSDAHLRSGALHLTPLKERDGVCVAYVGVFG